MNRPKDIIRCFGYHKYCMFSSVDVLRFPDVPTTDPCNKSSTCVLSGEQIPDPYNCSAYYICDYAHVWDHVSCPTELLYDKFSLECVEAGEATCEIPCEQRTTITSTTVTPASPGNTYYIMQLDRNIAFIA